MELSLIIDSRDEQQIRQWQAGQTGEFRIRLTTTGRNQDEFFVGFCTELVRLAPAITLATEKDEDAVAPGIKIGQRITYHAVPLGPELLPFLEALWLGNEPVQITPKADLPSLYELNLSVLLNLFIAPHCPFCPTAVRQTLNLAAASDLIRLTIIDGILFPDLAEQQRIQSAPTLLMDRFRWTGALPVHEIVRFMLHRDPADLGVETIKSILQGGGATEVAMMMRKSGKILPAFLELLTDPKWTVRLGAMVVMEELIETDIALASRAIQPLQAGFHTWDDSVKGDMVYLLGEIGNPEVLPLLEDALTRTENLELATAIEEALHTIQHKLK